MRIPAARARMRGRVTTVHDDRPWPTALPEGWRGRLRLPPAGRAWATHPRGEAARPSPPPRRCSECPPQTPTASPGGCHVRTRIRRRWPVLGDAVNGEGADDGVALAHLHVLVMRLVVGTVRGDVVPVAAGVTVRDQTVHHAGHQHTRQKADDHQDQAPDSSRWHPARLREPRAADLGWRRPTSARRPSRECRRRLVAGAAE